MPTRLVSNASIRSGDPRIEGTRITVLDIKRRVIDADEDPHIVAGEYDISLADLSHALAYYDDHREEFRERDREADAARHAGERRTRHLIADSERVAEDHPDESTT